MNRLKWAISRLEAGERQSNLKLLGRFDWEGYSKSEWRLGCKQQEKCNLLLQPRSTSPFPVCLQADWFVLRPVYSRIMDLRDLSYEQWEAKNYSTTHDAVSKNVTREKAGSQCPPVSLQRVSCLGHVQPGGTPQEDAPPCCPDTPRIGWTVLYLLLHTLAIFSGGGWFCHNL